MKVRKHITEILNILVAGNHCISLKNTIAYIFKEILHYIKNIYIVSSQ